MKKILVIDCLQDDLISIKALIKNHLPNCNVTTSSSSEEGVVLAQRDKPELILLDLNLPEMEGYAVCKELKNNAITKHIPILLMTEINTDAEIRAKGMDLCADALLTKPLDPIELTAQFHLMFRLKEAEDKLREKMVGLEKIISERTSELTDSYMELKEEVETRKKTEIALRESEKKFRTLYEKAPLPYHSLNENGCFIDVNNLWLSTLGYERDEVIGKKYLDFLHPETKTLFLNNFPTLKTKGVVHNVPFKLKHKNGNYIDIALEGRSGYNDDGSFKQTYCAFQDITKRLKAEEALLQSEKRYKDLVEMLPEAIIETDAKFNITYANERGLEMAGYSEEDIRNGLNGLDFFTEESRKIAIKNLESRFEGKEPGQIEYMARKKDGATYPVLFHANSIINGGKFTGLRCFIMDITERKQAEELLENKLTELEIFNDAAVDRELIINDLRKEINEMLIKQAQEPKYDIVE